ncbi:MAG: hypothetical protein Rubg2KO_38710 [Rubricoccaceae bacterium]
MRLALLILVALVLASSPDGQTRYEWVGGSSGDWTEASNWSPSGVPAAADTAIVGEDGQGTRVAILTGNTTVAGLEVAGLGVITGDFDLTVTADFLWSGGGSGFETFRGTGTITNTASSTLHMAEPTTRFQMSDGRTLVNDGAILWDGAGSWGGQGRLVNNGTLELAMSKTDAFIFSSLADAIINTATGVIRRTGSGAALFSAGLVNDGLIRVESAALNFGGFNSTGLTGSGSIEVLSGAEFLVSGRGNNTQAGITGDAVTITSFGGRQIVTDTYNVTTTRLVGTAGALTLNSDATIDELVMEGGVLDGSGDLVVTGSLDWTGGEMDGSGTTTLGPLVPLVLGGARLGVKGTRTLRTEGAVTWTGTTTLSLGSDATFDNAGTLTSTGEGTRDLNFGAFKNTGTLIHDGGAMRFFSGMSNEGEVRIDAGTLTQQGSNSIGGTDTGRYVVAEGARLEFSGGNRTLTASAEVLGAGTVFIAPNRLTNQATWSPGSSPGTLTIDSAWPQPQPEAVLDMEVGGATPGTEFDQLAVTGTATLGGTLRVTLTDGFTPVEGDRFLLIAASGGATGSFDAVELPVTSPEGYVQATSVGVFYGLGTPVDGETSPGEALPDELALHPPAPNPTRGASSMQVDLPTPARVRLAVYDALGREVAVALDEERPAGRHTVALAVDGLATGVYVVRLAVGNELATQRLTVVR